jgi:hypothetical protein
MEIGLENRRRKKSRTNEKAQESFSSQQELIS